MNEYDHEWSHIPTKHRLGLDRPNYNLRDVAKLLFALALIYGLLSLVLK